MVQPALSNDARAQPQVMPEDIFVHDGIAQLRQCLVDIDQPSKGTDGHSNEPRQFLLCVAIDIDLKLVIVCPVL